MTQATTDIDNVTPSHKTEPPCFPCQHCASVEHRLNACLMVSVCSICNTKNYSPCYICPLLQNSQQEQIQGHKDYHLDDSPFGHHNVKIKYDVNSAPKDLHGFPVTTLTTTVACHLPRMFHSYDVRFDERPHDHDISTPGAPYRHLDHEQQEFSLVLTVAHAATMPYAWTPVKRRKLLNIQF